MIKYSLAKLGVGVAVACHALTLSVAAFAQTAAPASICDPKGYTVAFFNGVFNDETAATDGMGKINALVGDTYKSEPVTYELMYNHTGSTVGATGAQDIAEVFIQRSMEIDSTGNLAQRLELAWGAGLGSSSGWWERVDNAISSVVNVASTLYTAITTSTMAWVSRRLSNPPTAEDYAQQATRLDSLILEGQKILFVAHSQGNLFLNTGFDYARAKASPQSIAAVHIAPASPTLRGNYVLADIDLVINALRLQGFSSVPPVNLTMPTSSADWSGHELIKTYLDATRPARARVSSLAFSALDGLVTPPAQASQGFFTVTLTWNGSGDVDLHTFEPNGTHVYYANKIGTSGRLDVDNTVANGPEHYFATCDPELLQPGSYQIGINNFARADGRTATIQVASAERGELLTRSMSVGAQRGLAGNTSPLPAFVVTVTKDASGKFSVSAQ